MCDDSRRAERWIALILLGTLSLAGCQRGPWTFGHITEKRAAELREEVKTKGLIVSLEGLQPFSWHYADDLAAQVASRLGLAHSATSGNYAAHLPFVEEAARNGQPIYLVGYSLGADQARRLAALCKEKGIPVRILFLLDPGYLASPNPPKIPDNVESLVVYTGRDYDVWVNQPATRGLLEAPAKTKLESEDFPLVSHADLPMHVADLVEARIRSTMKFSTTQPGK
jgi:pimeloyl-ACP methyl ester carboxylesterase